VLIRLSDIDGDISPNIFYDLGLVVTHQNYGYRGVIVAVDPICMAGDTWYKSNKTQPNRDQPWYHVLVHDSGGLSTYAAHSSLKQDTSGQPINHPRIGCYFTKLEDGCYCLKENHGTDAFSI
jgi:heat shock protein HspQ